MTTIKGYGLRASGYGLIDYHLVIPAPLRRGARIQLACAPPRRLRTLGLVRVGGGRELRAEVLDQFLYQHLVEGLGLRV